MRMASAGTMESNDCLIVVTEQLNKGITIEIESIVFAQFGDQIRKVIEETLKESNISDIHVFCNDKGALDYTIRARLITALNRLRGTNA